MASSDNLMTMDQPWSLGTKFADAWVSGIYRKETDTLTKALQMSSAATSSDGGSFSSAEMVGSHFAKRYLVPIRTPPTASGCSESEASAPVPRARRGVPPARGRVAKRKSRASKRVATTFIAADAANFRQMVQQVTGVRFAGLNGEMTDAAVSVPNPEPDRVRNGVRVGCGFPTLYAPDFLLDGDGHAPPDCNVLEFDPFCSFPTLESWEVV
ncbi:hypothetical protein OROGR_016944 [Orobanche gracilis]